MSQTSILVCSSKNRTNYANFKKLYHSKRIITNYELLIGGIRPIVLPKDGEIHPMP